jgi:hypothetical protein
MVLLGVQRLVVSPGVSGRFQVKQLPALAQLSDAAEVAPTKS